MKKFWMLALIAIFVIVGAMNLYDLITAKSEKTELIEVTEKNRKDYNWKEFYADYGDFCVNWYYNWTDDNSMPKYEVIEKGSGKRYWKTLKEICEMAKESNKNYILGD